MKRRILWVLILSLFCHLASVFAQDEADDEFFEDEESMVEPADDFAPPPNPNDTSPRRPLPRPSGGGNMNFGGGGSGGGGGEGLSGQTPEGTLEFRLVDPPAFKKPRTPMRIPYAIRQKVEQRLKKQDSE